MNPKTTNLILAVLMTGISLYLMGNLAAILGEDCSEADKYLLFISFAIGFLVGISLYIFISIPVTKNYSIVGLSIILLVGFIVLSQVKDTEKAKRVNFGMIGFVSSLAIGSVFVIFSDRGDDSRKILFTSILSLVAALIGVSFSATQIYLVKEKCGNNKALLGTTGAAVALGIILLGIALLGIFRLSKNPGASAPTAPSTKPTAPPAAPAKPTAPPAAPAKPPAPPAASAKPPAPPAASAKPIPPSPRPQ